MHKQNYSVNQLELYVVHVLFLFFLIDYKHKHTAVASELYVDHLLNAIFFYFLIDYKHKHTATGLGCYGAHALNPIFFIFK